jgi:hypothetical protein
LSVTKKTDSQQQEAKANLEQQQQAIQQKQQSSVAADENGSEDDEVNEEQIHLSKRTKHDGTDNKHQESELMIEPKPEYDDDDDDGQDENVEDLTLDDEELLDDMDQPGPSHGGEGSSQGTYFCFNMHSL